MKQTKKIPEPADVEIKIYNYQQALHQQLSAGADLRKIDRTKIRLRLAIAELLDQASYREIHITQICDKADLGTGTFYRHFPDKEALVREVLIEFLDGVLAYTLELPGGSNYETMYIANLSYMRTAEENPGLFRCLLELRVEHSELGRDLTRVNDQWSRRIASAISHQDPLYEDKQLLITIHVLGSLMDDMLRRTVVSRDCGLCQAIAEANMDEEDMCHHITTIWYRILYGEVPAEVEGKTA